MRSWAIWRTVALSAVALVVAAGALVAVAALFPARGEAAPRLTVPVDDPARGLRYAGLAVGTTEDCPGTYAVAGTDLCTHGPDPAPPGLDPTRSIPPQQGGPSIAATPGVVCDSDGTSGDRFQVLYALPAGRTDRYGLYLNTFRTIIADVDGILNASAAETGGVRHLRLVTDADCNVVVTKVAVSASAGADFGTQIAELRALGHNAANRKYLIFTDATTLCGIGTVWQADDSAGQANRNNGGNSFARVDAGCWTAPVLAHEMMHTLGSVLTSAPHATANGHCYDEYDRMCYEDGSGVAMRTVCTGSGRDNHFDCNHDDYFHTAPPAGSYLATHWNTANNRFLLTGGSVTPPPSGPIVTLTVAAASGGQVAISPSGPYRAGQVVTLGATPNAGQTFLGWSYGTGGPPPIGGVPITSWRNPLTLTLSGDLTVTPRFAATPTFGDLATGDPAYAAVSKLAALGVVRGYGNGNFGTANTTTRAEMAALICRGMGWDGEDWGNPFADGGGIAPALWRNVGTLAHYKVAYGYDPTHFAPNDRVTQAQTISFITRAMVAKGYWRQATVDNPALFPNVTFVSGHRWDLLTFYANVGAPPDTGTGNWGTWQTPATRGWFGRALLQALDSVYGR